MPESNERYLSLLAKGLPSKSAVQAELARIAGERALPKPPEIYVSDVHGEYRAFSHVIRNGAGSIRRTIDALFPDMKDGDRAELATLVYYPTEKIALWTKRGSNAQKRCASAITPLARVLASFASAYTHEHVRSTIEGELAPVVEELICMPSSAATDAIVASAASTGCADEHPRYRGVPCPTSTSSGATTTSCGWAPPWAAPAASRTWCATAPATATCRCSPTPTAST